MVPSCILSPCDKVDKELPGSPDCGLHDPMSMALHIRSDAEKMLDEKLADRCRMDGWDA